MAVSGAFFLRVYLIVFSLISLIRLNCILAPQAGALNLSSFISRQPRFGYHFIRDVSMDDKFFNLYKYLSKQQPMNLEWALQQVSSSGLYPLDVITAHKTLIHRTALACATRKDTLQDYYLPMYQQDWREVLLATCAIPLLYNQSGEYE